MPGTENVAHADDDGSAYETNCVRWHYICSAIFKDVRCQA